MRGERCDGTCAVTNAGFNSIANPTVRLRSAAITSTTAGNGVVDENRIGVAPGYPGGLEREPVALGWELRTPSDGPGLGICLVGTERLTLPGGALLGLGPGYDHGR